KEIPILVMPNAGMPINENGQAKYLMSPEEISAKLSHFVSKYEMIRIIGGCCGTSPSHIRKLRYMLDEKEQFVKSHKSSESNL
ncbi:MAG TPA: homocysteine S-methyltransferase family protein, partial [Candidatus Nitrosocosmicus sp.]|nr:homocysteine S-methyltransferase family protein [Candidatus Nitrosocosmicus sp.]